VEGTQQGSTCRWTDQRARPSDSAD